MASCRLGLMFCLAMAASQVSAQELRRPAGANSSIKVVRKPTAAATLAPTRTANSAKPQPKKREPRWVTVPPAVTDREKAVKRCQNEQPKVYFKVKGRELSASGTDVDEIYGYISMSAGTGKYHSSYRAKGWFTDYLWTSAGKSINIGKTTQTFFPTVTDSGEILTEGGTRRLSIHMDLTDEDGSKGGADEDFFFVHPNTVWYPTNNALRFSWPVPSCKEAPEYKREARVTMKGVQKGSAHRNKVFFSVHIQMIRSFSPI